MFLTIFHQVVITTSIQNSTIHLCIKSTLWWGNPSLNFSEKNALIKKVEFHEAVPTRLWVNWTLCGITSTWRERWRTCSTSWWPRPGAQAWSQQALNISLRLWKATQDLKSSNTENHTGAMYDIYSVIPEEKRLLVNSPILQMKAIKNEVVALTIWMFLSFFYFYDDILPQVEVNGMMEAHARDSAALCSWAAMMEDQVSWPWPSAWVWFKTRYHDVFKAVSVDSAIICDM